jgi:CBS domain containing-hemolysin-like protein
MSISFLCSIFEACLLSISSVDIGRISLKKPKRARILSSFKDNIQKPIAIILIVNTLAHTIGASLSGARFNSLFGAKWILAFSLIYALAMIQWTEILPKTLGVKYNKFISSVIAYPLQVMIYLFSPIVWVIELLNKPFVRKSTKKSKLGTIDELSAIANYAYINKSISKNQEQIISRTIETSEKKVKDIMIPLKDMKVLKSNMTLSDALIQAHIHNHTRYPLVDENERDYKIIGYVNFKDITSALNINPDNPSVAGIKRPIMTFSSDDNFNDVFKKMIASHQHIAIVKSPAGKITGLITLEDIIEEIIGEIEDEYDVLPEHLYQITENRFIVGSGLTIDKINHSLNINLPDPDKTLENWLFLKFDKAIKPSAKLKFKNACFVIRKVRRNRVYEIILEINR